MNGFLESLQGGGAAWGWRQHLYWLSTAAACSGAMFSLSTVVVDPTEAQTEVGEAGSNETPFVRTLD